MRCRRVGGPPGRHIPRTQALRKSARARQTRRRTHRFRPVCAGPVVAAPARCAPAPLLRWSTAPINARLAGPQVSARSEIIALRPPLTAGPAHRVTTPLRYRDVSAPAPRLGGRPSKSNRVAKQGAVHSPCSPPLWFRALALRPPRHLPAGCRPPAGPIGAPVRPALSRWPAT